MKTLVDIVNFNADASCLSALKWINTLAGGKKSNFCQWLNLYIKNNKRVSLGLTGASIADLNIYNHEAIDIINDHRQIFEIILRPFSHDIALLRTHSGFYINYNYGKRTIIKEFQNYTNYFLPPEFMCTSSQIQRLTNEDVDGIFINTSRFNKEIQQRISHRPYYVKGLFGSKLKCLPLCGDLTDAYLFALQLYEYNSWGKSIEKNPCDCVYSWRDGESVFLLPDGIKRENFWLSNESNNFQRLHLKDLKINCISNESKDDEMIKTYPVHQFTSWIKEMRMLWFINRVQNIEEKLESLSINELYLWLHVINSDILSAVEKNSPIIKLRSDPDSKWYMEYTIKRSERGFDGEEYLELLENYSNNTMNYINSSNEPHILKLMGRVKYLKTIDN